MLDIDPFKPISFKHHIVPPPLPELSPGPIEKSRKKPVSIDEYKSRVKPWWLGQRIIVNKSTRSHKKARIMDYCVQNNKVQLWYDDDEDDQYDKATIFEKVELSKLSNWTVPDTLKISEYSTKLKVYKNNKSTMFDFIPSCNTYKPMNLLLGQQITILYRDGIWYRAFIDGYDPISRRHHVNFYGNDTSQWIWTDKKRVSATNCTSIDSLLHLISPPQWDPEPYGLTDGFSKYSRELVQLIEVGYFVVIIALKI